MDEEDREILELLIKASRMRNPNLIELVRLQVQELDTPPRKSRCAGISDAVNDFAERPGGAEDR